MLSSKTQLVIISMAWLSLLNREELNALADKPDMDTFQYWIRRFWPLLEKKMNHNTDIDSGNSGTTPTTRRVIIVFSNRVGEETGGAEPFPTARYAGTSAVIAVTQRPQNGQSLQSRGKEQGGAATSGTGEEVPFDVMILCWDIMGAAEEGICFADTTSDPKMVFGLVPRRHSAESEQSSEESDMD